MCFAPQRRALFRHPNFQKWSEREVFLAFFHLQTCYNVLLATTACTFSTSQLPKVVREWCAFVHFDLEMCFAPQRRALFWHLNFQKWSETANFLTFWLRNVLRATTTCTFSTSQLPKVVRKWGFFSFFTCKRAITCFSPQWRALFRHRNFQKWSENGVLLYILTSKCALIWPDGSAPAALASLLFDPPEPWNHWKIAVFGDFPTFSRICIFFLLTLSLLWSSLFYSSLLSGSSHLCFSSVHIVGSLTSKLPSMILNLSGGWNHIATLMNMPRTTACRSCSECHLHPFCVPWRSSRVAMWRTCVT